MTDYKEIIDLLSGSDYYKLRYKILSLINNQDFIEKIINEPNPFIFDRFIKMVEYKMDTEKIHEKRNIYIKKQLLSNQDLPDRWLVEDIVEYYFHDNYYIFMTNFYQMINYLSRTKKELIDKNNIILYKEFINLRNMSNKDKISFFQLFLDSDSIMGKFYDDISKVREDSHKYLTDSTIKLTKDNNIYQKGLSEKIGVDVYYLNGENFYGFVRCFSLKRSDLTNQFEYVYSKKEQLGYSFSYIGAKNIGTIDYNQEKVALFYDDINYRDIMYVHHGDLHAKMMNIQNDYLSLKENEIVIPEYLIAKTKNYNEIYIKWNKNGIKPTALICYDVISKDDVKFASYYNLSILLINRDKYRRVETFDDECDSYTYQI